MTKQIINIAIMVAVMVGLTASVATAQDNKGNGFAPVGIFTGMENQPGTINLANQMTYGNSFVLNSFGEWETHHLRVSVDYSTNSFYPGNHIATGGSWSLVVIRENQYAGTLYGEVQTGSVNLITDNSGTVISKHVQLNLEANGGLGIFSGQGSKEISGVCDILTNLRSKETSGNASFTF